MSARRVLVVDDEEMVCISLQDMLELAGYEVAGFASDGDQALPMVRELRPDVVLMDISMPRMDGIRAAAAVTAEIPTPIVFLSAYHDSEHVTNAGSAGGHGYLMKPCRYADLAPAIEKAIVRFQKAQGQSR